MLAYFWKNMLNGVGHTYDMPVDCDREKAQGLYDVTRWPWKYFSLNNLQGYSQRKNDETHNKFHLSPKIRFNFCFLFFSHARTSESIIFVILRRYRYDACVYDWFRRYLCSSWSRTCNLSLPRSWAPLAVF